MHHARNHRLLRMRAHHDSQQQNHQSRHRIQRKGVRLRLSEFISFLVPVHVIGDGWHSVRDGHVQQISDADRLHEHAEKSTTNEQNGNRNMLKIFSTPFTSPVTEMLEKDICRSVGKDQGTLDKLGRWAPLLSLLLRSDVPCPAKFAKATGPPPQRDYSKPEENAAFDPMR
jgi:hypothetical protein